MHVSRNAGTDLMRQDDVPRCSEVIGNGTVQVDRAENGIGEIMKLTYEATNHTSQRVTHTACCHGWGAAGVEPNPFVSIDGCAMRLDNGRHA